MRDKTELKMNLFIHYIHIGTLPSLSPCSLPLIPYVVVSSESIYQSSLTIARLCLFRYINCVYDFVSNRVRELEHNAIYARS